MTNPVDNNIPNSAKPNRQQFGLPLLFYLTAVYATGLTLGPATIVLTTIVLLFWWLLFKNGGCSAALLLIAVFLLIGMLLPAVSQVREAARSTQCLNNIRQLTLAIHNYESSHSKFPSAKKRQADGSPPYSWRVEILPYVEEQALFDQYDFNEPWDGPNNIKLIDQIPYVFVCPSHHNNQGLTPYKVVADKGTAFEPGKPMGFAEVQDGTSNTLCVIEDFQNPVPWTKPTDLTVEQAIKALVPQPPHNVAHLRHDGFATTYLGSNVSLLDGSCHRVGPTIAPETVRGICLCDDGKFCDLNSLGQTFRVIHHEKYLALAVYVILLLLPGIFITRSRSTSQDT